MRNDNTTRKLILFPLLQSTTPVIPLTLVVLALLGLSGCEDKSTDEPADAKATSTDTAATTKDSASQGEGADSVQLPAGAESPAADPNVAFPNIPFESYKLANGLNVILHVDRKLPVVNLNVWYHVGSKNEELGRTGFAHLFEHMMFQGSKHVKGEYLNLIEKAGANLRAGGVNGTTNSDRTNYFATVPSTSLEYAIWLESDRMGFLLDKLTQTSFDNQVDVVKNEKRQRENRPYAAQSEIVAASMYPKGHPYGHTPIGSIKDLTAASLDDVRQFFRKYYAPNNATLTLSGNFNPADAKKLIGKYFGSIPAGPGIVRPKVFIPELASTIKVKQEERTPLPKLTLVWHAPQWFSDEQAPLDFAASHLSQGKTATLYKKLVRDEKLASSVKAYLHAREAAGLFFVEVIAKPEASLEKIKDIVVEQIEELADSGPSSDQLEEFKAKHEYEFVSGLERVGGFGGKADRLNAYQTYLGTPNGFQRDYDRYQNLEKGQVRDAVKKWIHGKNHLEIQFISKPISRAISAQFDRTVEPTMAGTVSIATPKFVTKSLENGLNIIVMERRSLPKVEATMLIPYADLGETAANAGLSYLTAASMDEGTPSRDALEIQSETNQLGSHIVAGGTKFGGAIGLSSLKSKLNESMQIFADVIRNPSFPETEVDLVRKLRLDEITRTANRPQALASELFPLILFAGTNPAGINPKGTKTSLEAIKREDLVKNHQTFWRPNHATLVMAGAISVDEAVNLAEKHFGNWEKQEIPKFKIQGAPAPNQPHIFLVDAPNAAQSQIRIGSISPTAATPDKHAIEVTNGILGGTFSSRLNLNLREDKGYSYGAFSGFALRRTHGYWTARAGVQTAATILALQEFRKEIEGLAGARPVTATELNGLKKNLSRGYLQKFETLNQVIRQVSPLIFNGEPISEIDKYIPAILQQTPETVQATAQKYLRFNNSIILVAGDLRRIEKPIRDMNWGKVIVVNAEGKVVPRQQTGQVRPRPAQQQARPVNAAPAAAPGQAPTRTKTALNQRPAGTPRPAAGAAPQQQQQQQQRQLTPKQAAQLELQRRQQQQARQQAQQQKQMQNRASSKMEQLKAQRQQQQQQRAQQQQQQRAQQMQQQKQPAAAPQTPAPAQPKP